jgi:hypothetical protein
VDRVSTELAAVAVISFAALCLAWWREADGFSMAFAMATALAGLGALNRSL